MSSHGLFLLITIPIDLGLSFPHFCYCGCYYCCACFCMPGNFLLYTGHCRKHTIQFCDLLKNVVFFSLEAVMLLADHLDLVVAWFLHIVSMDYLRFDNILQAKPQFNFYF